MCSFRSGAVFCLEGELPRSHIDKKVDRVRKRRTMLDVVVAYQAKRRLVA